MKIQHFIGIDISNQTLDVCILSKDNIISQMQIKNQMTFIRKWLIELKKKGINEKNSYVCAEHTGRYGDHLRLILEDLEMTYFMVGAREIQRSIGLTRGKNDQVDAKRIAQYCQRFLDKLSPSKLPEEYLKQLKDLFVYRESRVKTRTARKNMLKSYQKSLSSAPQRFILNDLKKEIKRDDKVIKAIEEKMIEIIRENPQAKKNFELIQSVIGMGPITASYLIVITQNFSLFNNARKFASYSGLAPFEHTSGSSIKGKTRTSRLRNKQAKTLLLRGANAAITGKNELSKYYNRKLKEGKNKNVIKNAIAFKIITRVFAVIQRQSPYLQTYGDKFAA